MSRIENMQKLRGHTVLGALFRKLTQNEMFLVEQFLEQNELLSDDDFIIKVNRWYLDSSDKPKHLTNMWSILIQSK